MERDTPHKESGTLGLPSQDELILLKVFPPRPLWYTSQLTQEGISDRVAVYQPSSTRHFAPRDLIIDRKTGALSLQKLLAIL